MPIPLDNRKKPTHIKIHVSTGAGVDVHWADSHASHYDFPYLREQCPCALCDDERRKKAGLGGSSAVLPMFKPKAMARSAAAVGNYAIKIEFTDGHSTGIYSFDYLRTICPCDACRQEFAATE